MKKIIYTSVIFYLTIIFSVNAQNNLPKDALEIGEELTFSSEKYKLTRSGKPYNNYFIQEYIRPKETINSFVKSIVVMAIVDTTTVDQLLDLKLKDFKKLKEKNNSLTYEILLNDEGGRMVEFTLNDKDFVYWNIQRFDVQKTKTDQTVGVIYTYVEKKSITELNTIAKILQSIKEKRVNYITEVGEIKLPKVNL